MKMNIASAFLAGVALFGSTVMPAAAAPLVQRGSRWVDSFAQADAPKPVEGQPDAAAKGANDGELRATVVAAKGTVQWRMADDQPWVAVKAGDKFPAGAEIRTGLSAVQLHIEPGHTVTIDRFTVIKLITLTKQGGVVKTDVGMKYGRTRYDVEAAGAVHDAKIHTPGTTLAIRGTSTGTQTDAFTESTWVIKGAVDNTNKLRREIVRMDSATGKAVVTSDLVTPGAFAKNKAKNDAKGEFAGRQATDEQLVEQYASGELDDRQGGVEESQRWARRDGFQFAAVGVFGDVFDLDIFWLPTDVGVADLDLLVHDPLGGQLDPSNLATQIVRSGQPTQGQYITIDDGQQGVGFEAVQYGPSIPTGSFLVTIRHDGSGAEMLGTLTGGLQSNGGSFGSEDFIISSDTPVIQYIVDAKNKTITPVGGGH